MGGWLDRNAGKRRERHLATRRQKGSHTKTQRFLKTVDLNLRDAMADTPAFNYPLNRLLQLKLLPLLFCVLA
jgi:hypothetical protein